MLYRQQLGRPGCAWDEEYPCPANIREDLELEALYLLLDEGELVAAASCGPFHELDHLPLWRKSSRPFELARVCVRPDRQGQGLASQLLKALDEITTPVNRLLRQTGLPAAESHPAGSAPPGL